MMVRTFCLAAAETIMGCETPKNRRNMEAILIEWGCRRKSSNAAGLSSETDAEGYICWMTMMKGGGEDWVIWN